MWTENDCDASKKRKAFKNFDNGKLRGGGGAREGVGRERKGVEGPTPSDSLADWVDGLGRPGGCTRLTGQTASAVHAYGRPHCRPIGRCDRGIRIQWPQTTAQPYAAVRTGHKRGTGHHSPTHLNGRAGRFGIFCLIACAPLSVVVEFRTTSFFFLLFPFHCVLYFRSMRRTAPCAKSM